MNPEYQMIQHMQINQNVYNNKTVLYFVLTVILYASQVLHVVSTFEACPSAVTW